MKMKLIPTALLLLAAVAAPAALRGQDTLGTYEMSDVEEMPAISNRARVIRAISELYPPALRAQGVRGEVTIRMLVDARGVPVPGEIEAVESTNPEFAAAAVLAAAQMRFRPARNGGKPVPVRVTVPVTFQAPAPAPAPPAAAPAPAPASP